MRSVGYTMFDVGLAHVPDKLIAAAGPPFPAYAALTARMDKKFAATPARPPSRWPAGTD